MTERSVVHETVAVRRTYDAAPERVFRAWTDPAQLQRWYVPGDETWSATIVEHDFRIGGRKRITFGTPADRFSEDCWYVDIVANQRICYAMTVAHGEVRISVSMVTAEFLPHGRGCALRVTDQLTILDGGDTAEGRQRGWGETLDKLPAVIAT